MTTKYFAYVRKSTEGEERQALSIQSQIDKAKENFGNLEIVEILEEKHSAFKPHSRPIFLDMIKRIQKGEADGIIAWHPDRLSRNEIDASTITYLVRTNVIKDLKFGSYNFDNSPEGIMMLQLSLSQSQYFSSKLGKDVKRGLEQKFNMGWQPNMCPNGYINFRNNKTGFSIIKVDKKRFNQIQQAFDLMLSGNYSVPEILDKLNNDWGFKPKNSKTGKLSRSSLYRIFTNIFYAGIIEYNGKQKEGKHKAMITLQEFDRIQLLMGRHGKPRYQKHKFAYTGMIRCSECGCLITADLKKKYIKSKKTYNEYTYYRCTHKKASYKCLQPAIEVKTLEKQIYNKLEEYDFNPKFEKLFFKIIKEHQKENPDNTKNIIRNLKQEIKQLEIENSNLTGMSCKKLIPDSEFLKERNKYNKKILDLQQKVSEIEEEQIKESQLVKKISYATKAKINFVKGDKKTRKEILSEIGSNHELKDKTLLIKPYKWLTYIEKGVKPIEFKYVGLELYKFPLTKAKNELLDSLCCELDPCPI